MILLAMAIGAGIGALAGAAVYGAKVLFSKKETFSWKALAAHAVGGLVGGGLFPVVFAGLGAIGVPAAGAYVLAGGIAWGGLWSLAQDGASWALGLTKGMGRPRKYLTATAVGLVATAVLLPFASRAVGPGLEVARHAGTAEAFLLPSKRAVAANLVKSEAEFLAYGAMSETAGAVTRTALRRGATRAVVREAAVEAGTSGRSAARPNLIPPAGVIAAASAGISPGAVGDGTAEEPAGVEGASSSDAPSGATPPQDDAVPSPAPSGQSAFGAFAHRVHDRQAAARAAAEAQAEQTGPGCVTTLERALGD